MMTNHMLHGEQTHVRPTRILSTIMRTTTIIPSLTERVRRDHDRCPDGIAGSSLVQVRNLQTKRLVCLCLTVVDNVHCQRLTLGTVAIHGEAERWVGQGL